MDAQTLLDRCQNVSLLKNDKSFEWEALTEKYPYFNIAQLMKYGHDALLNTGNLAFAALYKNDPLKFAELVHQVQEAKLNKSNTDKIEPQYAEKELQAAVEENIQKEEVILEAKKNDSIEQTEKIEVIIQVETDYEEIELISNLDTSEIENLIEQLPLVEADNLPLHPISSSAIHTSMEEEEDKSLMVMMSFTDWLNHFKHKTAREKEELQSKKALKTAWQKEKLSAAIEEEGDEIPEGIFKQAMESISDESIMISESLAGILAKQGKKDKAIDMYKKLSLRNPEKSAYFASLINDLNISNN